MCPLGSSLWPPPLFADLDEAEDGSLRARFLLLFSGLGVWFSMSKWSPCRVEGVLEGDCMGLVDDDTEDGKWLTVGGALIGGGGWGTVAWNAVDRYVCCCCCCCCSCSCW